MLSLPLLFKQCLPQMTFLRMNPDWEKKTFAVSTVQSMLCKTVTWEVPFREAISCWIDLDWSIAAVLFL